jgi:hypothetical protein
MTTVKGRFSTLIISGRQPGNCAMTLVQRFALTRWLRSPTFCWRWRIIVALAALADIVAHLRLYFERTD